MSAHNPVARYCVVTDAGIPRWGLRDDVTCPACDENRALLRLDPDFAEEMRDYPDPPAVIAARTTESGDNA